ncbi:hypothetical protein ACTA71_006311 [Dictyostelium dimigraforme]
MSNNNMSNDPYGHLFFNCIKTKEFIKIHKLKRFLFDSTGNYALNQFHKPFFEWNYKAINYDLNRSFAYGNLIALILHHIWIWICNQLYSQEKEDISTLDYELILKKWHKSARLEFIKKIKTFKLDNSKQPHLINTPNTINNITIIRNEIIKDHCIPKTILPKRVIIDKFI